MPEVLEFWQSLIPWLLPLQWGCEIRESPFRRVFSVRKTETENKEEMSIILAEQMGWPDVAFFAITVMGICFYMYVISK